jgi:hypothetical protein
MKGRLQILAVVIAAVFSAGPVPAANYQWTLSSSSSDPYMNVGGATGGIVTLYVWLACTGAGGASALGADLTGPPGSILGVSVPPGVFYVPESGFIFVPCTTAPALVASVLALSLPGSFCFVPIGSSEVLTYDCQPSPQPHATAYIGFSNSAGAPCSSGTCPDPVSVDPTPWGSVKGLYR